MASHAFGSFVEIDSSTSVRDPPAVLHKGTITSPSAYELDNLPWGSRHAGPSIPPTPTRPGTPVTPNQLEMSRPPSPVHSEATEIVQTLSNPPMNKWRFLSVCFMNFGQGLNDSALGALLPYIEKHYNIGYAIVSLIFLGNALGFISAAPFTHALEARLGRAKLLILALGLVLASYIAVVCTPPFPVVVVSFFLTGLGCAICLALNNVFCANLANATTTLGCMHGSYGIGGTVGPLMATALVSTNHVWSSFYLITLSATALNLLIAYYAFRTYETDNPSTRLSRSRSHSSYAPSPSSATTLKNAVRDKTTLLGALFIFAYQGAEVSISGWVISFLLTHTPHPTPSLGYVTAGFWAGITLGRFLLSHPAHRFGEKRSVFLLIFLAAIFQLLVWLVPNVIGEAVAISIVGLLLGPVYPCATVVFCRLLGRTLQTTGLAFVSAMGSSGGALAPFATGLAAQRWGTWVLHPVCMVLFASMAGTWGGLGRLGPKRRE